MKTYFNKLNEKISKKGFDIIQENSNIINNYFNHKLFPKMNKLCPNLKIFTDINYDSPIIEELRKNNIFIDFDEKASIDVSDLYINENSNELKKVIDEFDAGMMVCINEIVTKIRGFNNYDEELRKDIIDTMPWFIKINFIDRHKKTGDYVLVSGVKNISNVFSNDNHVINYYSFHANRYKYRNYSGYNSLHDTISKEHLIEVARE